MAEIKSTMEMVLERAARMAADAPQKSKDDTILKEGMRIAAAFINGEKESITAALQEQSAEQQGEIRQGMVKVLLRNIVLPRDEELHAVSEKALQALVHLSSGGDVEILVQELAQILGQYNQHKEQAVKQLDDAIRSRLQQQAMAQGIDLGSDINPAQHPQYESELSSLLAGLNGQYNDAMDERKEAVERCFT